MKYNYSSTSKRVVRSEIRELLKWSRKPGVISFGGGLPDASLFPIEDIIKITESVLHEKGYLALQYGPTQGEAEFMNALINHMDRFGDKVTEKQICITSSSQQGLDLVTLIFLDDDADLVMELPSYIGGIQAFRRSGARMHGIPLNEEGMDLDALQKKLDELDSQKRKPRFIYAIPDFQNPSGITMSLDRRKKLVQISKDRDIPLLEDSPYRELSFTGKTLPSLWTLSGGEGVIMLKTFSKTLLPGMRMGWLVAPEEVIEKVEMMKQSVDLCTPSFTQLILASYINQGKMKKSIDKAIECYIPKSKAMLDAMDKYMPKEVWWSKPTGGMFLWIILPENIDAKDVFMKSIDNNVAYVPGQPFHCDNSGKNTLRLNYSFPSIEQIETGIKSLADAIKSFL